jgi:hypothetical protein
VLRQEYNLIFGGETANRKCPKCHTKKIWKATTEYHKTKDILHVMRVLGHKNITNTLRYTQLIQTTDDDFITKVAKTVEEACKLIEAGYEYVTEFQDQGVKIFRKRK